MDKFTQAYFEAALWSSVDDNDEPLDQNYSVSDIAPETRDKMIADCAAFQEKYGYLITEDNRTYTSGEWSVDELAGHDFWLTRNGHGSGFWAGGWVKSIGEALSLAAKSFGSFELYVDDERRIKCAAE
jgi:hypothetical protein